MKHKRYSVVILLLILDSLSILAQNSSATMKGTVIDPQGAAVPKVKVIAVNQETKLEYSSETDTNGEYTIVFLPAADYIVTIEAAGFKKLVSNSVRLEIGQTARIDLQLQVGGVSEVVNITDVAPILQDQGVTVGNLITTKRVDIQPIKGRNYIQLALLVPGVVDQSSGSNDTSGQKYSTVASNVTGANITIDRVAINDSQIGGAVLNLSTELIGEIRALDGALEADAGRAGSLTAFISTKSGTNEFHGGAFIYFRDDKLQARGPFGGLRKPNIGRQQFGGTFGGPIIRNKMFFFLGTDFIQEDGATAVGYRNTITHSIVSDFASTPYFSYQLLGKVNVRLTDDDIISGRYTIDDGNGTTAGYSQGGKLQDPSNFQTQESTAHQGALGWAHTFNPTSVNDFNFGVLSFYAESVPRTSRPGIVFPSINIGSNFRADRESLQHQVQLNDQLSLLRGRNSISLGVDYGFTALPGGKRFNLFNNGLIFVPCDFPGDPGCRGAISDSQIPVVRAYINRRMLGNDNDSPNSIEQSSMIPGVENNVLGLYAQDSIKLNNKITLSVGLRLDYDSDSTGNNQVNAFSPRRRKAKIVAGPRIGGAWTIIDRISIRGGYGLLSAPNLLETRQRELLVNGARLPLVRAIGGMLSNPFANVSNSTPSDIYVTSNSLQTPYIHSFSASIERELPKKTTASVEYLGQRGNRFWRLVEINKQKREARLNTKFASVLETQSIADTQFDSLRLKIERRFASGVEFLGFYSISRSINEDSEPFELTSSVGDPLRPGLDRGPAQNEARHRFLFSGSFELPLKITLSPIIRFSSSLPVEIIQNTDFSEGIGANLVRVPGLSRNSGNRNVKTGADVNKIIDEFNANLELVRLHGGPISHVNSQLKFAHSFSLFDIRVSKDIRITELVRLRLSLDAFNIFNHINVLGVTQSNLSGLQNNIESPSFGAPLGVTPGGLFGSGGPRSFQVAARLNF